jgi:CHASE3 domain sensor protein
VTRATFPARQRAQAKALEPRRRSRYASATGKIPAPRRTGWRVAASRRNRHRVGPTYRYADRKRAAGQPHACRHREIEQALAALQDAETGQRGFLITGDDRFLDPYSAALARIPDQIRALREGTVDNPQQQASIGRIEAMSKEKLAALKEGIDRRRRQPVTGASPELELLQSGKTVMDEIRSEVADMRAREESLLKARGASLADDSNRALGLIVGGNVVAVLLLVLVFQRCGEERPSAAAQIAREARCGGRGSLQQRALRLSLPRQGWAHRQDERYRADVARIHA